MPQGIEGPLRRLGKHLYSLELNYKITYLKEHVRVTDANFLRDALSS